MAAQSTNSESSGKDLKFGFMDGVEIGELFCSYSSDVWSSNSNYYVDFTRRQLCVDIHGNWKINILPIIFSELFFKESNTSKSNPSAEVADDQFINLDDIYFYDKSGDA